MFKKFTTKELTFLALMGALIFAFDFIFVSGIDVAFGVPGTGLLVDSIIVVAIGTIGGMIVRKFGSYTIMTFIYCVLTVPTNLVGPPGVYKLIFGVALGMMADIIILISKYKQAGYYLSLPIASTLCVPLLFYSLSLLHLPGAEELSQYLWVFMIVVLIESLIGVLIGMLIYKRISKISAIRHLGEGI